jgi:alcohol dehydrogenase class IV
MLKFQFATAAHIIFGSGKVNEVSSVLGKAGAHPLLVTGENIKRAEPVLEKFRNHELKTTIFTVETEPTIEKIVEGAQIAIENQCDVVVGMGGGSVLDAAKAISALIKNQDNIMDYLEVIGLGKPLLNTPIPWIAIPTTAGTGAEVTKNAVLKSSEHGVKISLRHPGMLPKVAIIDPELTISMPP